jgi:2-methylisocitrate lyase-like PEP mutase family enzyme
MSNSEPQRTKAGAFRALHRGPRVLVLPNVWDVASARVIQQCGFPAIATTSAGIAFSLGHPDGEKISRDEMLEVVARIACSVNVPVTADIESGYGPRPEDATLTTEGVIEAGAVGMNLEDGTEDPKHPLADLSLQLEKIAAVRETAERMGVPLVLNARTDVYLLGVGLEEGRYEETLRRLSAFRDVGADCVFAPGLKEAHTIKRLVSDLRCPVNILAGPGSLAIGELEQLGVARVSMGSAPMRVTLGLLRRIADELKSTGTYQSLADAPSHAEVNQLME